MNISTYLNEPPRLHAPIAAPKRPETRFRGKQNKKVYKEKAKEVVVSENVTQKTTPNKQTEKVEIKITEMPQTKTQGKAQDKHTRVYGRKFIKAGSKAMKLNVPMPKKKMAKIEKKVEKRLEKVTKKVVARAKPKKNEFSGRRALWHMVDKPIRGMPGYDFRTRIGSMQLIQQIAIRKLVPGEVFYVIPLALQFTDLEDPWSQTTNAIPASNLQVPAPVHDRGQNFTLYRWLEAACIISLTLPNFDEKSGGKIFVAYIDDVTQIKNFPAAGQALMDELQSRKGAYYREFPISKNIVMTMPARFLKTLPGPGRGDWLYTDTRSSDGDVETNAHVKGAFIVGCAQAFNIPALTDDPSAGVQWDVGLSGVIQFKQQLLKTPMPTNYLLADLSGVVASVVRSPIFLNNVPAQYPKQWDKAQSDISPLYYIFDGTTPLNGAVTPPNHAMGMDISKLVGLGQALLITCYISRDSNVIANPSLQFNSNVALVTPVSPPSDVSMVGAQTYSTAQWLVRALGIPAIIYPNMNNTGTVLVNQLHSSVWTFTVQPDIFDGANLYANAKFSRETKAKQLTLEAHVTVLEKQLQQLLSVQQKSGKMEIETPTPQRILPDYYKLAKKEWENYQQGNWSEELTLKMKNRLAKYGQKPETIVDCLMSYSQFPLSYDEWPIAQQVRFAELVEVITSDEEAVLIK